MSLRQTTFQGLTDLEELLRNIDPVRGLTTIAPGGARGKDAEKPTGPTPIVHQGPFAPWTGKEIPH